jgi:hypothetical protein
MNDGRGHDGRLTKQFIAIYHKPTHTLKFIPSSEKGTVFSMNQNVTSYHDSKSFDFRNLSMNERRRMVFESFGSQKKKKVMRSQDANVVEMKSVVGAGEGMMKALGSQMEGGAVSESNKRVMEDLRKGSSEKVCVVHLFFAFYGIVLHCVIMHHRIMLFLGFDLFGILHLFDKAFSVTAVISHTFSSADHCSRQGICRSEKSFPTTIR